MVLIAEGEAAGWVVGVIGAVGGLLTIVGTVVINLLMARAKALREDKADVWARQAELVERQDRQLAILQAEQQRSLVAEMACRQEVARLRALGQWLYDLLRSQHAALERAGGKPDPLPEFADFAAVPSTTQAETEFRQRQMEHGTALLRQELTDSQELTRMPPGGKPDDSPPG